MNDICRLCEKSSELADSHILPKSIFKWMKETSATGYLRSSQKMNVPQEDGLKIPFLCHECEQQFSVYEKYFKEKIFLPLHENQDTLPYNNELLKFSVSIVWRALKYTLEQGDIDHLTKQQTEYCYLALKTWREYLFNKRKSPGRFQLHFYNLVGEISATKPLPENIHRYLLRSIGYGLYNLGEVALVYINLLGNIIVGYIYPPRNKEEFKSSMIVLQNGIISPKCYVAPKELFNIIENRAHKTKEFQASISIKQQEKILEKYKKNSSRVINSETIQAYSKDLKIIGKSVDYLISDDED